MVTPRSAPGCGKHKLQNPCRSLPGGHRISTAASPLLTRAGARQEAGMANRENGTCPLQRAKRPSLRPRRLRRLHTAAGASSEAVLKRRRAAPFGAPRPRQLPLNCRLVRGRSCLHHRGWRAGRRPLVPAPTAPLSAGGGVLTQSRRACRGRPGCAARGAAPPRPRASARGGRRRGGCRGAVLPGGGVRGVRFGAAGAMGGKRFLAGCGGPAGDACSI